jgi:large subunit ribosomal protein L23
MSILKRPILTERTQLFLDRNQPRYGFAVSLEASKEEIKAEVERLYGVKVAAVNTMIVRGKRKTRYSKRNYTSGKRSNYKKAIVTLEKGFEIDFYKHI